MRDLENMTLGEAEAYRRGFSMARELAAALAREREYLTALLMSYPAKSAAAVEIGAVIAAMEIP